MLARALRSVDRYAMSAPDVELLVSDNDPDSTESVARPLLAVWPGPTRYLAHRPNIGMVANFNQCVSAASGEWILILHDDDYLLPGALERILATVRTPGARSPVRLFGTSIVDECQRLRRHQRPRAPGYLPPCAAVERVLTNSSFVRFPSMVVRRDAYQAVGPFRDGLDGTEDVAMWVALFSRYGVCLESSVVSAYSVHPQADTSGMFRASTLGHLLAMFEEVRRSGMLPERQLDRARRSYLEQFILAGTYRQVVAGQRDEARRVLALLDLPAMADVGRSAHWAPVAWLLDRLVRLPSPAWPMIGWLAGALEPFLPDPT